MGRYASISKGFLGVAALAALTAQAQRVQPAQRTRQVVRVPARGGPEKIVQLASMTTARAAHTATLLPNGQVLIAGGIGGASASRSTELFDPTSRSFRPGPDLLEARAGSHTATLLPDGRVLIAGGWQSQQPLASAEIYDPSTGAFSPAGPMTTRRAEHTATLLPNGEVLLAAGVAMSYDRPFLRSAEIYDPSTDTFRPTGSLLTPRRVHIASLLSDGRVLIMGGSSARGNVLASAEIYDPATGTFRPAGAMVVARYKHAAAALADGRVLVIGGSDARDDAGRYASTELFDPSVGTFLPWATMSEARYKLQDAVALLPGGDVLVGGGGDQVEVYEAQSGNFRVVGGNLGDGRLFMTTTTLPGGAVVLAGGYGYHSNVTAEAWLYLPGGQP